jgi:hypothetical protein
VRELAVRPGWFELAVGPAWLPTNPVVLGSATFV